LTAEGLNEQTVIVFSSDHGEALGEHRLSQKQIMYDSASRVPMIVRPAPAAGFAGRVDGEHLVAAGVDLLPTFCDYAGVAPPRRCPGLSLRPLVEGRPNVRWRDYVVCENQYSKAGVPLPIRARLVRTARHKYIAYDVGRHREQVFDLASDPGEMHNLVDEPACAGILGEHRRMLSEWCRQTGDSFSAAAEGMPLGSTP